MPVDRVLYQEETIQEYEPPDEEPRYFDMQTLWPSWHSQARCLGEDESVFFGSSSPDKRPAYTMSSIRKARSICKVCPVFEECLRQAIHNREAYGVWASTTMKERSTIFALLTSRRITEDQAVGAVLRREGRSREYRRL